jgi:hypothetical protein
LSCQPDIDSRGDAVEVGWRGGNGKRGSFGVVNCGEVPIKDEATEEEAAGLFVRSTLWRFLPNGSRDTPRNDAGVPHLDEGSLEEIGELLSQDSVVAHRWAPFVVWSGRGSPERGQYAVAIPFFRITVRG